MKKFLMIGAAAASAMAMPATAQTVTGTINITGTVTAKCTIVGGATATTYVATRDLGELDQADGTLEASATLATRFGVAGTTAPAFRVVCNSAAPQITVDANPLVNGAATPTGYNNTVNYIAHVAVNRADSTTGTFDNATTGAATGPAAVGGPISGAAGNNVTVTADTFSTPTAAAPLVAGAYTGNIVVTISPV
ncbi:hypothetical protein SPAN111604_03465 [Sphingomonas antarctica]|uniref:hypothetical protein n=1 Tax=Sphingomonas antarctica TaxID=2040274 RepID=UPI0039E74196